MNNFNNSTVRLVSIKLFKQMFFRKIGILLFTFTLLVPKANGQDKVLKGDDREHMIRDVLATWPKQFHAIEINSMKRLDDNLVQMNYISEGSEWEAILQTTGVDPILVETANVLPPERWPEIIVDAWKNQAEKDRYITRVLRVSTPYGEQGFRVESLPATLLDGKLKRHYFDPFGMPKHPFF